MLGDEPSVLEAGPLLWALHEDPAALAMLEALFKEGGYRFEGFSQPQALLNKLDATPHHPPALLVLEVTTNQQATIALLRSLAKAPDVPALVITNDPSQSSLLNLLEAGAVEVMRRPFGLMEFLARVQLQIWRSQQRQRLEQEHARALVMAELAAGLGHLQSTDEAMRALLTTLRSLTGASCACALRLDPSQGQLQAPTGAILELVHAPQVSDALASRQLTRLPTKLAAPLLSATFNPDEDAALLIPVFTKRRLFGAVLLACPSSALEPLEGSPAQVLSACDMVALVLERISLHAALDAKNAELERTNQELVRTRDYLAHIIDASPNAIVVALRDGKIIIFNAAAEAILGWRAAEAIGMDVRRLYPQGVAQQIMGRLRADDFGGPGRLSRCQEFLMDKRGELIPVEISASLLFEEGRELGSVGIFIDQRDKLALKRELEQVSTSLGQEERRQVDTQRLAQLAGAAAHELNQPLMSIGGYLELIGARVDKQAPLTQPFLGWIAQIEREVARMTQIVQRLERLKSYKTTDYIGSERIVDLYDQEHKP